MITKYNQNHDNRGRFSSEGGGGGTVSVRIKPGTKPPGMKAPRGGSRKPKFRSGVTAAEEAKYNQGAARGQRFKDHVRNFEREQGVNHGSHPDKIRAALIEHMDNTGGHDADYQFADMAARHYGVGRDYNHVEQQEPDAPKPSLRQRLFGGKKAAAYGRPGKQPRRKMRRFQMMEISAVDRPAQEGALATMTKRDTRVLIDGIVDHYLSNRDDFIPDSRAMIAKRVTSQTSENCRPLFLALAKSLQSIVNDDSLTDERRISLMRDAAGDFLHVAKGEVPDIERHLAKGLSEGEMNVAQLKKQIDGLGRKLDSLVPRLEQVSKARATPMNTEDDGSEADAAARLRNLLTSKSAADYSMDSASMKARKKPMASAGMEDDPEDLIDQGADEEIEKEEEAECMKPTSEGEEEDTIAAGSTKPIGGKRYTSKRSDDDEDTLEVGGRTISKAAIGDDLFDLLAAQQEELADLRKRADDERDAREMVEFEKVAESELGHLPGTPAQKATILRDLSGVLSKEQGVVLTKMLKAGNAATQAAFRTVGHGGGFEKARSATSFTKRVAEIKARDNCSNQVAMQKARQEHPEEYDAYQGN